MAEYIHVSIAWPYANGDLHVGHLAGAYLPADIFARYHRLLGNHVLMVSGSDSHGTPISLAADKEGVTPREIFERYHKRFLDTQQRIGISYDLFTHTDTKNHHKVAQDIFLKLLENGYLYREKQKQLYSETEGRFLPDRYVEGTCPICGYEQARGDQCDNCGNLLNAVDLINPRSKIDGSRPVVRETEHFFLDLPAFADRLAEYLGHGKDHWRPNVLKFSQRYIEQGLHGRPITRDLEWGIPVPLDGWEGKRLYVWFEAVMGYLSASIEWAERMGEPERWKDWWYNPDAKMYYFIGKDNIPFHTLIWPAELMGVGRLYEDDESKSFTLPYDVPANEYMNIEGAQASKSRGWAIWLPKLLERYDPDAIRYYIASVMPETRDTEFRWGDFVRRNNDELVATWGNLVNRMLSFAHKHFEGRVPEPGELRPADKEIIAKAEGAFKTVGAELGACHFRAALRKAMEVAHEANRYLDQAAPWFQIKEDRQQAATTVYTILRVIDNLKILLAPYLPFSAEKLHRYLGYERPIFGRQVIRTYEDDGREHQVLTYERGDAEGLWEPSRLPAGRELRPSEPLFAKLDPSIADEELAKLG